MRHAIVTLVLLVTAAPASAGVVVTRVHDAIYQIRSGPLLWTVDGYTSPRPPDPRVESDAGDGLRIRSLAWTDPDGATHTLLSCGNCDLIEAVRLPDAVGAMAWSGPGYGMSRPGRAAVTLDGVTLELPLGLEHAADVVTFKQTTIGYAPGEPVTAGSLRRPVTMREVEIAIDATGARYSALVTALDDHDLAVVYSGRLEGDSMCTVGIWDGFRDVFGSRVIASCLDGPADYGYPVAQPWVELTSSLFPDVALRVTNDGDQPWFTLFNAHQPDRKMKIYGRPVNRFSSPLRVLKGERRAYGHRVELLGM